MSVTEDPLERGVFVYLVILAFLGGRFLVQWQIAWWKRRFYARIPFFGDIARDQNNNQTYNESWAPIVMHLFWCLGLVFYAIAFILVHIHQPPSAQQSRADYDVVIYLHLTVVTLLWVYHAVEASYKWKPEHPTNTVNWALMPMIPLLAAFFMQVSLVFFVGLDGKSGASAAVFGVIVTLEVLFGIWLLLAVIGQGLLIAETRAIQKASSTTMSDAGWEYEEAEMESRVKSPYSRFTRTRK